MKNNIQETIQRDLAEFKKEFSYIEDGTIKTAYSRGTSFGGSPSKSRDLDDVESHLHQSQQNIIKAIEEELEKIQTEYPKFESNDYDKGNKDFKAKILKILKRSGSN